MVAVAALLALPVRDRSREDDDARDVECRKAVVPSFIAQTAANTRRHVVAFMLKN